MYTHFNNPWNNCHLSFRDCLQKSVPLLSNIKLNPVSWAENSVRPCRSLKSWSTQKDPIQDSQTKHCSSKRANFTPQGPYIARKEFTLPFLVKGLNTARIRGRSTLVTSTFSPPPRSWCVVSAYCIVVSTDKPIRSPQWGRRYSNRDVSFWFHWRDAFLTSSIETRSFTSSP